MVGLNNKTAQVHYSEFHAFGNHQVYIYFIYIYIYIYIHIYIIYICIYMYIYDVIGFEAVWQEIDQNSEASK